MPSVAPDEPSELARTITSVFDDAVLGVTNLAAHGRVLVPEDQSYRSTAEITTGAQGVWLQAAFMFAVGTSLIDASRYDDLLVGLAARRHGHMAIDVRSLVRAMEQDGTEEKWLFDALAEFIGTKDADVPSHVDVVKAFLADTWSHSGEASLPSRGPRGS